MIHIHNSFSLEYQYVDYWFQITNFPPICIYHLLQAANIPACFLGSGQLDKSVYAALRSDRYRIVYVTPEFIDGV